MRILRQFIDGDKVYEFPDVSKHTVNTIYVQEDKVVSFMGKTWEWISWDANTSPVTLTYGVIDPMWEFGDVSIIGPPAPIDIVCDCGADSCNHPGHSEWCSILTRNGWDEAIRLYQESAEVARSIMLIEVTPVQPAGMWTPAGWVPTNALNNTPPTTSNPFKAKFSYTLSKP